MATIAWPLPHRFRPQIDSWAMTQPNLMRRTEMDDGEDRVRRTASFRPTRFNAAIDIELAELAVLRRWIEEDADQGRLWFDLTVWIDDAYAPVEARLVPRDAGLFEVTLADEITYRVTLSYEVRRLPRAGDELYYTALVGGTAELAALTGPFNTAINVELKAAAA